MSAQGSLDETGARIDSEHVTSDDGHHPPQDTKPKDVEDTELLRDHSGSPTSSANPYGAAASSQENGTSDDDRTQHDAQPGGSGPSTGIPRHQPSHSDRRLRSISGFLREHIPENSVSPFASRIHRARSTRAVLLSGADNLLFIGVSHHHTQAMLRCLGDVKPGEHAVLIVQDVNEPLCDALRTYSSAVGDMFFLRHILGIDSFRVLRLYQDLIACTSTATTMRGSSSTQRTRDGVGTDIVDQLISDCQRIIRALIDFNSDSKGDVGFHVNCQQNIGGQRATNIARSLSDSGETLDMTQDLISCCRLSEQIYLVLQDGMLDDIKRVSATAPRNRSHEWHIALRDSDLGQPAILPIDSELQCSRLSLAVHRIFETYPVQSVLVSTKNDGEGHASSSEALDGRPFTMLLMLLYWQGLMETQEESLMRLQQLAASEDDAKAFSALTKFRRGLAPYPLYLDKLRSYLGSRKLSKLELANDRENDTEDDEGIAKAAKEGTDDPQPERLVSNLRTPPRRSRPINLSTLVPRKLKEYDDRLKALREVLNDEIQVTIGSVQVNDAQVVKRQTTSTVVLAVLAAIYLPLTLVTGIFGMNISEISLTEGAPNAWVAFGTWVVITVLTVAGIWALYVAVKRFQDRKEILDLEANPKKLKLPRRSWRVKRE